jgi:hypothetical protein
MGEMDKLKILLDKSDDDISKALKSMALSIDQRFDGLELQHDEVKKEIKSINEKIDDFKRELVSVRFFSTHPKMLLTVLIAIFLIIGSRLPGIFSFFAKLL